MLEKPLNQLIAIRNSFVPKTRIFMITNIIPPSLKQSDCIPGIFNNQQVEGKMALALFELGYLELADPRTYMLSERGRQLAEHPAPRVETGARWALTSEAGRKIHFWREYMVAGKYPEYEAGCGLVRLLIWKKEQTTGYYCPDCMRSSSLTLLPGIQNEP